ncbi:hypothetical protein Holit_01955 [Hollandina sp. SP2]
MKELKIALGLVVTAIAASGDFAIKAGMLAGYRRGKRAAPAGLTSMGDTVFSHDRLHCINVSAGQGSGGPFINART